MQQILFFHGGPGLNSNPERNLLTETFKQAGLELICWDEPSAQRPEGYSFDPNNAFNNYLKSSEDFLLQHYNGKPVILLGYCFGCNPVNYLINHHPEKIKLLLIITPDFCLSKSDRNIFSFVHKDYQQHNDANSIEMKQALDNYAGVFDENTAHGWLLAANNPRLFNYYWRDEEQREQFLQFYSGIFSVDLESFFSVRKSWFEIFLPATTIPAIVLHGKYDNIISIKDEVAYIADHFEHCKIIEMEHSSHYPHIEETDRVIGIIRDALAVQ